MPSDAFNALFERYVDRFGEAPLIVFGVDDDTIEGLMREALGKGRPIPEDDYDRDVPDGADR